MTNHSEDDGSVLSFLDNVYSDGTGFETFFEEAGFWVNDVSVMQDLLWCLDGFLIDIVRAVEKSQHDWYTFHEGYLRKLCLLMHSKENLY